MQAEQDHQIDCSIDYMLEVMQAYKEGKAIEYLDLRYPKSGWGPANTRSWNWSTKSYRIKPQSEDMELKAWNLFNNGKPDTQISDSGRKWMRDIIEAVKRGEIK